MRWLVPCVFLFSSGRVLAHEGGAVPADVWTHWNTNPLILASILLPSYLYARGVMRYPVTVWRKAAFWSGMLALFVALISPLDAVSGSLFAGHMVQHLLLILVAAPLLVLSRPVAPLLRGMSPTVRQKIGRWSHLPALRTLQQGLTHALTITLVHIVAIWLWHIPVFYSAAVTSPPLHALEHASFFGTAILYWWMIARRGNYGERVISVFAVMMLTGVLGVLMTFATSAWYPDHAPYVAAWGLTTLEDQQLAGLLMWIPSGVVYALTAVLLFGAWLNTVERRTVERERRMLKEISHV